MKVIYINPNRGILDMPIFIVDVERETKVSYCGVDTSLNCATRNFFPKKDCVPYTNQNKDLVNLFNNQVSMRQEKIDELALLAGQTLNALKLKAKQK